jgi:uncharacterized protein YndB with AHSA1/START domain
VNSISFNDVVNMPAFELVEQREVDADVSRVFQTLRDMNQWSTWWPGHPTNIRGPEPLIQQGSIVDIQVKGYAPITISLVATIRDLIENQSIAAEWKGDLVGHATWTLKPMKGKTLVQFHIKAHSNRFLISFFSIFMSPTRVMSTAIQDGFKRLNDFLVRSTP